MPNKLAFCSIYKSLIPFLMNLGFQTDISRFIGFPLWFNTSLFTVTRFPNTCKASLSVNQGFHPIISSDCVQIQSYSDHAFFVPSFSISDALLPKPLATLTVGLLKVGMLRLARFSNDACSTSPLK